MQYIGAVEAGGTKINCAVIDMQRNIKAYKQIKTTTPQETISRICEFFSQQKVKGLSITKLGLACFGPLDLNKQSATYGNITTTPKNSWSNTPILSILKSVLSVPIVIDTDVNAAALAEYYWGNAQQSEVCVYITVGTGVGGGLVINGRPVHGLIHPEMGHMFVQIPQQLSSIKFEGACSFHNNCVEGLASGTSMRSLWHTSAESLEASHDAWVIQSEVLAGLCHNLLMTLSPNKIVFGGGVMKQEQLLNNVIKHTHKLIGNYLTLPNGLELSDIIVSAGLGDNAGLFGAFALTTLDA